MAEAIKRLGLQPSAGASIAGARGPTRSLESPARLGPLKSLVGIGQEFLEEKKKEEELTARELAAKNQKAVNTFVKTIEVKSKDRLNEIARDNENNPGVLQDLGSSSIEGYTSRLPPELRGLFTAEQNLDLNNKVTTAEKNSDKIRIQNAKDIDFRNEKQWSIDLERYSLDLDSDDHGSRVSSQAAINKLEDKIKGEYVRVILNPNTGELEPVYSTEETLTKHNWVDRQIAQGRTRGFIRSGGEERERSTFAVLNGAYKIPVRVEREVNGKKVVVEEFRAARQVMEALKPGSFKTFMATMTQENTAVDKLETARETVKDTAQNKLDRTRFIRLKQDTRKARKDRVFSAEAVLEMAKNTTWTDTQVDKLVGLYDTQPPLVDNRAAVRELNRKQRNGTLTHNDIDTTEDNRLITESTAISFEGSLLKTEDKRRNDEVVQGRRLLDEIFSGADALGPIGEVDPNDPGSLKAFAQATAVRSMMRRFGVTESKDLVRVEVFGEYYDRVNSGEDITDIIVDLTTRWKPEFRKLDEFKKSELPVPRFSGVRDRSEITLEKNFTVKRRTPDGLVDEKIDIIGATWIKLKNAANLGPDNGGISKSVFISQSILLKVWEVRLLEDRTNRDRVKEAEKELDALQAVRKQLLINEKKQR